MLVHVWLIALSVLSYSLSFLCWFILVVPLNLVSSIYIFSHSLHSTLYKTPSSSFFTFLSSCGIYTLSLLPSFCLFFYICWIIFLIIFLYPPLMHLHSYTSSFQFFFFFFLIHIFFHTFFIIPSFRSVSISVQLFP